VDETRVDERQDELRAHLGLKELWGCTMSSQDGSPKKLYRSRRDKWIAGIAGGMASYFNIDPTVVRVLWLVTLLPGGVPGLILYIVCWAIIPKEPDKAEY